MEYLQKEPDLLQDFFEFIGVRTAFWGFLAIISVFLPLSNYFSQVLPLEKYGVNYGVFDILSPTLITVITTVVTLVAVISIFTTRGSYRGRGERDARRKAWISIRVTIATLIGYIIIHKIYSMFTYPVVNINIADLRKLYFEVPLLLAYATFFSHLTQTLMLVAMTKFYRDKYR